MHGSKTAVMTSLFLSFLIWLPGCKTLDRPVSGILDGILGSRSQVLSPDTIAAGLKEALQVGTQRAVDKVSQEGGYASNPDIAIPLPEKLEDMAKALRAIGLGSQVDAFQVRMNRAAELAAKEAAPVFLNALREMTITDARQILQGGNTAATEYFQAKTSDELKRRFMPLISAEMEKHGVVSLYEDLEARYNKLPLVPRMDYQIEDYVADEALQGLFTVLGNEEKQIREQPAARTTELLKLVFGGK
jgi:hypothetical protein